MANRQFQGRENQGDALKYEGVIDLRERNNAHTQLILATGRDKDVLEVGPARGYMTKVLRDRGCRVTTIEIDPVAAKIAAEYADRMIVGNVEQMSLRRLFRRRRFDVVIYGDVLEHLVDPGRVLRETVGILRHGGSVLASIPNVAHASIRLALLSGEFRYTDVGLLDTTHLRFFTRESIDRLFRDAGYEIRRWQRVMLDPKDTEVDVPERDFPPALLEEIRKNDEALTYQYVVQAVPQRGKRGSALRPVRRNRRGLRIVRGLRDHILGLEREITHQQELIALEKKHVTHEKKRIARQKEALHEQTALVLGQRNVIDERDNAIAKQGQLIEKLEEDLRYAVGELEGIRRSVGFRLFLGLRRRIGWLFPSGSLRGRFVSRLVHALARRFDRRMVRQEEGSKRGEDDLHVAEPAEYVEWIHAFEPAEEELGAERFAASHFAYSPLISIVVPVWKPALEALRQTVESARRQTYSHWELCITDGGSSKNVRAYLQQLAAEDERVKLRFLDENLGISGNTNEALTLASGEFVAFLDHTDMLAPFALAEIVRVLNRDASLDYLYSDHDLLDAAGRRRYNPFFAPGWSPEMLLSVHYLAHLSVIRRRLIDEVGGLRPETDGAQDWDLMLRIAERTNRIRHVPGMLYHWRADPESAAISLESKPYAAVAQVRAVQEALERRGIQGVAEPSEDGALKIRWQVERRPKISIIIPTKHNRSALKNCLSAIARSTYPDLEVLVVETAGFDEQKESWYRSMQALTPFRVVWWDQPFNYSAVNNLAARQAAGEVLLFLNDDTEPLETTWIEELLGWIEQSTIGVVGAQLVTEDGTIQHGGVVLGMGGFADHLFKGLRPGDWSLFGSTKWYRNASAVTGACLMIRREVFEEIGGWDETFIMCGSDVELCLRARQAGYRVLCTPFAQVRHLEGATRGTYVPPEDFFTSLWHYQKYLYGGDPYFHPRLSLAHTVPQFGSTGEQAPLAVVSGVIGREVAPQGPSEPSKEAVSFADRLLASDEHLASTTRLHAETRGHREVTSINWFIPDFENPFYGGIHTIFRFADHFLQRQGVKSRFVVIGTGPVDFIRSGARHAFPSLEDCEVYLCPGGSNAELDAVPFADASIATLWVTAYPLLRFGETYRKFYLAQDFEPIFYPAGTVHALAEQTYRMGFYGICNTETLRRIYEEEYGGRALGFTPAVDPVFQPHEKPRQIDGPLTVFFYGRPSHARNSYELAIGALRRVKEQLGDGVRIVTAGSWADPAQALEEDFVEHLGLLEYEETARLYRSCDIGLVISVSKHPSYLPMQLMASGSLVVSNVNPAGSWLLRDEENCLLAPPTADALQDALLRGLLDRELRQRLTTRALSDIRESFSDWETPMEDVYRFMCDPDGDG